jgi:hypothetical protein
MITDVPQCDMDAENDGNANSTIVGEVAANVKA